MREVKTITKNFLDWIKIKEFLHFKKNPAGFETSAPLSQARTISSKRLVRLIDKMSSDSFKELKTALNKAIFK